MKFPIYFDYNATTPVDPLVFDEMKPYLQEKYGNSSSVHFYGFEAESGVKLARKRISELINSLPEEIYFTSGATESINIIHMGIAKSYAGKGKHIISTNIEHPAVIDSLRYLEQNGFRVTYLPVNNKGLISLEELERIITPETILVSIMAANNEIGVINDLTSIGRICRKRNIFFHTDASQAMGKNPLDVERMDIDLLSFSGHKFYAPKGIGGFYMKKIVPQIKLSPLIFGGGQEKGIRPGTLNVPGIAAVGKAAEICLNNIAKEVENTTLLRDFLLNGLRNKLDNVIVNGDMSTRLPNNLNLRFEGVRADKLMIELKELAFSTGSACSSGSDKPSHVLKALGMNKEEIQSSVRISIGRFTTEEEIQYAIDKITEKIIKIRNYSRKEIKYEQTKSS